MPTDTLSVSEKSAYWRQTPHAGIASQQLLHTIIIFMLNRGYPMMSSMQQ